MASAADLLNLVRTQLGRDGKTYWDWYFGGGYVNGNVTPFCACGVSWALAKTNTKCAYFPSALAFDIRDKRDIGSAWVNRNDLRAGDVVTFDWNHDAKGDHVGFIESKLTPTTYQTLEFNTSGGIVARRTRSVSDMIGGIRPQYSGDTPAPKPEKLAEDGSFGAKTKAAVQTVLKDKGYYRDWQVDGIWGYGSITSLQAYLRDKGYRDHDITGDFGYWSTRDLQQYLRAQGFRDCDVTGTWGHYTTLALQKCLNAGKF